MSIFAASLLAIAILQGSQSQTVWKWQQEPQCSLRQQLDGERFLIVSRMPGSDQTAVMLHDHGVRVRDWQPLTNVNLTFEPGGQIAVDGLLGPGLAPATRAIAAQLDAQGGHRLAEATALALSHSKFGTVRAAVRSPAAAMEALKKCEDQKLAEWGVDPASLRSLKSRPIPVSTPASWFDPYDYPRLAAAYGVGANIVALLEVGPDGRVQACKSLNQHKISEFSDSTCRSLKKRARFTPATNTQGQPVAAPFILQIRYTMSR